MAGAERCSWAAILRRGFAWLLNDMVLALLGVVVGIVALALGGVALTWLVYRDRYGVGFLDYLTDVVL